MARIFRYDVGSLAVVFLAAASAAGPGAAAASDLDVLVAQRMAVNESASGSGDQPRGRVLWLSRKARRGSDLDGKDGNQAARSAWSCPSEDPGASPVAREQSWRSWWEGLSATSIQHSPICT